MHLKRCHCHGPADIFGRCEHCGCWTRGQQRYRIYPETRTGATPGWRLRIDARPLGNCNMVVDQWYRTRAEAVAAPGTGVPANADPLGRGYGRGHCPGIPAGTWRHGGCSDNATACGRPSRFARGRRRHNVHRFPVPLRGGPGTHQQEGKNDSIRVLRRWGDTGHYVGTCLAGPPSHRVYRCGGRGQPACGERIGCRHMRSGTLLPGTYNRARHVGCARGVWQ